MNKDIGGEGCVCLRTDLRTALLVIDIQKPWWTDSPQIQKEFPHFEHNMIKLLAWARSPGEDCPTSPLCSSSSLVMPLIVHIRAVYNTMASASWLEHFAEMKPDRAKVVACVDNVPEEFAREVDTISRSEECKTIVSVQEVVVEKATYDGFHGTDLEEILNSNSIEQVLLCGLITSVCVHHTAHSAYARGFRPVLVQDCSADLSIERHQASIGLYGNYIYKLAMLDELLQKRRSNIEKGKSNIGNIRNKRSRLS